MTTPQKLPPNVRSPAGFTWRFVGSVKRHRHVFAIVERRDSRGRLLDRIEDRTVPMWHEFVDDGMKRRGFTVVRR